MITAKKEWVRPEVYTRTGWEKIKALRLVSCASLWLQLAPAIQHGYSTCQLATTTHFRKNLEHFLVRKVEAMALSLSMRFSEIAMACHFGSSRSNMVLQSNLACQSYSQEFWETANKERQCWESERERDCSHISNWKVLNSSKYGQKIKSLLINVECNLAKWVR